MLGLGLGINKKNKTSSGFISTWKTDNLSTGSSNDNQVKLPLTDQGTYNFTVFWGDGTKSDITAYNQAEVTHTYSEIGTYQISILGKCEGWRFDNSGDKLKILNISNWGKDFKVGDYGKYFYGCSEMNITAVDKLNTDSTTSFELFFRGCSKLDWNINFTETSQVTSVYCMFFECSVFNSTINIDLSNCTVFGYMLHMCVLFNQPINLDTSKATNLSFMFRSCHSFNQPISLDTSKATNMNGMFYDASNFNQDISQLDYESTTNVSRFLEDANSFSTANYDLLLISLANQDVNIGLTFDCNSNYTLGGAAESARDYLINTKLWTISDLGGV